MCLPRQGDAGRPRTVTAVGSVEAPPLGPGDPHPTIQDFYESLNEPAQAKFYEPSDWRFARFICHFM